MLQRLEASRHPRGMRGCARAPSTRPVAKFGNRGPPIRPACRTWRVHAPVGLAPRSPVPTRTRTAEDFRTVDREAVRAALDVAPRADGSSRPGRRDRRRL